MKMTDATKICLVIFAATALTGCDKLVFDATDATDTPLAAVVAPDGSGVASVYTENADGTVSVSTGAQTAISAATTAATSSGNALAIALASVFSALVGAGASIVASKKAAAKKAAESTDDNGDAVA